MKMLMWIWWILAVMMLPVMVYWSAYGIVLFVRWSAKRDLEKGRKVLRKGEKLAEELVSSSKTRELSFRVTMPHLEGIEKIIREADEILDIMRAHAPWRRR